MTTGCLPVFFHSCMLTAVAVADDHGAIPQMGDNVVVVLSGQFVSGVHVDAEQHQL